MILTLLIRFYLYYVWQFDVHKLSADSVIILPQKTNFDLFVDAAAPTAPVAPTLRSAHAYSAQTRNTFLRYLRSKCGDFDR